jgi:hypothetical protein
MKISHQLYLGVMIVRVAADAGAGAGVGVASSSLKINDLVDEQETRKRRHVQGNWFRVENG